MATLQLPSATARPEIDEFYLKSHTDLIRFSQPDLRDAEVSWLSSLDVSSLDAVSTYMVTATSGDRYMAQVHDHYDETEVSLILPLARNT